MRAGRPWLVLRYTHPCDARGWIGLGCFLLTIVVLAMIAIDRSLLESDAFLILATAIIITGWVQGPVGWAYQATKGGGELADRNADIVRQQAEASPPIADDSTKSGDGK